MTTARRSGAGLPSSGRGRAKALKRLPDKPREIASVIHELKVYQDELGAQNRQLVELQNAVETAAERYAELYHFAPVALLTLDEHGCIVEMNFLAASLFEVERSQCSLYPLRLFVAEAYRRRFLDHLRQCRSGERSLLIELEFVTRNRRLFRAEMTIRRAPRGHGGQAEFRCAIVDLTERLEAEEARRRADDERHTAVLREEAARASAEAKDRFIAMLSHELRTPLTPILATANDLELSADAPVEFRRALARIRRNVEMEVRLIDDLLDVSRIERNKFRLTLEAVYFDEVLREALDGFTEQATAKGVAVDVKHKAERCWLEADRIRLQQVVANLLRNALEVTPKGGRITVRLENAKKDRLRVSVDDDGAGISREQLSRIFRPFEHAGGKAGGLGLGLSISRGIIEAHGGTIEASSDGLGRGARFAFELKALSHEEIVGVARSFADHSAKAHPSARTGSKGAGRKVTRVLIVEDHLDSAETLAEVLQRRGYRTRIASSIETALSEAEHGFELLISDIGLPDGSGHELMEKLRARGPVRAIALSGFGSEKDVAASHRAGFVEHLTKPVDIRALLRAIERACESSAAS